MIKHIFLQERTAPFPIEQTAPITLVDSFTSGIKAMSRLQRRFGWSTALRTLAKSAFPNRRFFFTPPDGAIASSGGIAIGFCNFYAVETDAVVIGTIETLPEHQGQGLATKIIKSAMNAMIAKGYTRFYIDTQEGNTPMLRSIQKLGFGPPIKSIEG
jgi:RimJ/RimL family protein N-acetyltransferase